MDINLWLSSILDMTKLIGTILLIGVLAIIVILTGIIIHAYVLNFYYEKHKYTFSNYNMSFKKYWKSKTYFFISNCLTFFFSFHLIYWIAEEGIRNDIVLLDIITLGIILIVDNIISWILFKKFNDIKINYLVKKIVLKILNKELNHFIYTSNHVITTLSDDNIKQLEDYLLKNQLSKFTNEFKKLLDINFKNRISFTKFFLLQNDISSFMYREKIDKKFEQEVTQDLEKYCKDVLKIKI